MDRLIAIMLGRFRMTVPDCLWEYRNLGGEIFGKPRFFTQLRFALVNRTKYDGARLKKVFEDVTARRSERLPETDSRITFPSKRGLCKTLVSFSLFPGMSIGGVPCTRSTSNVILANTRSNHTASLFFMKILRSCDGY